MTVVAAGVVAGGALIGGIISSSSARKQARRAEAQARRLNAKLENLEANRQEIINPFEGVQDLSNMLSNPFATLGVATQAAEMKIEQADISLANTLDTIRSTGASAGGATALAQAALQSKKGVAASIEQQEAQNEKMRVQGEQTLQRQQMGEQQRLQQADVSGRQFVFGQQEQREMQQLNRLANQIGALRGQAAAANQSATAAMTGAISAATSTLGAGIAAN
jgi:hypothetical protein